MVYKIKNSTKRDNSLYEGTFTIEKAKKIQQNQIDHYNSMITDKQKKKEFNIAVKKLKEKNKYAVKTYDIPRGVEIEYLYYTIVKGYSDQEYGSYLRSLD